MNVVGYLRVSTTTQADEGFGLDVQRASITRYADASGLTITAWTEDAGVSGALTAEDRPGLTEALGIVKDHEADGLVVAKLDRLARRLDVQEATLGLVWHFGGQVHSADMGLVQEDDPEDPYRTALRRLMGVFSELERAVIRSRMVAGRRLKAERGGYVGGRAPYGFTVEDDALVACPVEQRALDIMRALHSEGASLRAIGDALVGAGIEPRGAAWHPTSIARILARSG
jgi:DNA invertase Pin-like site-specific DNA recombinase